MGSDIVRMPVNLSNVKVSDGSDYRVKHIGNQGDELMSQFHGALHEQAVRGALFGACSQAATTTTVALAATYTGFCLSNPAGSGVRLAPRQVGIALSVAPAAIAPIGIGGGYIAAGVVTHTTPLTVYNGDLGISTVNGKGLADAACALPGSPRVIMPMLGGFTAAALFGTTPAVVDLQGYPSIPPGGYIFIYTLTVVIGLFGMNWEELPL